MRYAPLGQRSTTLPETTVPATHLHGYEINAVPLPDRIAAASAAESLSTHQTTTRERALSSASASIISKAAVAQQTQDSLLSAIDHKIDITPRPRVFATRRDSFHEDQMRSVIHPGSDRLPEEDAPGIAGEVGWHVDRNPDQIRACIARLVRFGTAENGGEWTLDSFRKALGGFNRGREPLNTFLERRGDDEEGGEGSRF